MSWCWGSSRSAAHPRTTCGRCMCISVWVAEGLVFGTEQVSCGGWSTLIPDTQHTRTQPSTRPQATNMARHMVAKCRPAC